jgi:hypothetical protein
MKGKSKTPGMNIRYPKQRGEWAELCFMAKAAGLGFKLNRPFGESTQYDVVVDLGSRFVKVQVKSTWHQPHRRMSKRKQGVFRAAMRPWSRPQRYQLSDFDYLAFYVIPKDVWYIIPAAIALARRSLCVRPGDRDNKYERYREAWHLLRERPEDAPPETGPFLIFASIEEPGAEPTSERRIANSGRAKLAD